jgi:hypothetical protein
MGKNTRPDLRTNKARGAVGIGQVVESLPSKYEVLSSNPIQGEGRKGRRKRGRERGMRVMEGGRERGREEEREEGREKRREGGRKQAS